MYCPAHFQEDRPSVLLCLIERYPLGTVIANGPSGLVADHIPLLHEPVPGSPGTLIGHVARANSLWQSLPDQEFLVVFQGPSCYISPNWYVTKKEAGKVVPTWNYAVVHVHATLRALHEPDEILPIITKLTDRQETSQAHPWRVSDAPPDFTETLLANIVGIEFTIRLIQGKWKVSQNQPAQNQLSVVEGLLESGKDASGRMARLVTSCGKE